jgi:hypothetical protein
MRWRRPTNETAGAGDVARTALLAGLIAGLLVSGVAVVSTATTLDMGPKVGDILVFRQGARMPGDWEFTVATRASPAATCSLRPEVMASEGGSLVVEERLQQPRAFHVHWAGAHTSEGTADCGNNAELVLAGPEWCTGPLPDSEVSRRRISLLRNPARRSEGQVLSSQKMSCRTTS